MKLSFKYNLKQNTKVKLIKNIALALCICFILSFILLTTFISTHENHDHDHHGPEGSCFACIQIISAKGLLNHLFSTLIVIVIFIYLLNSLFLFYLEFYELHIGSFTLVSLKARLDE